MILLWFATCALLDLPDLLSNEFVDTNCNYISVCYRNKLCTVFECIVYDREITLLSLIVKVKSYNVNVHNDITDDKLITEKQNQLKETAIHEVRYMNYLSLLDSNLFVKFYGWQHDEENKEIRILMENCFGDAKYYKSIIKASPIKYITQLLTSINTLHSKNVAHRDIKPKNILMCKNGSNINEMVLKLADFESCTTKIVSASYTGTFEYSAPENLQFYKENWKIPENELLSTLKGVKFNLKASDMYSIGASLGKLLDIMDIDTFNAYTNKSRFDKRFRCYQLNHKWIGNNPILLEFIQTLTHCDPTKRFTASQAQNFIKHKKRYRSIY